MPPSKMLTADDCQRVEAAIADLEQRSAAEIVVAVVPQSATYEDRRALLAGAVAVAACLALVELTWSVPVEWAIALQLPIAVATFFVLGWAPLHRRLIPRQRAERAVEEKALELFAERGVHRTRDGTGVVIVISQLEHRVAIFGDHAIHARVSREGWQRLVTHLVGRIREKRAADGLVEVIQQLGVFLESALPPAPRDTNELPNAVVFKNG